jgi:Domain of unknown function (DUF4349)
MTSPETLELEAVDAALAGRYVAPEHAELAELALLLRDDKPEPAATWATHLDRRVEAGFPARPRERRRWVWVRNAAPALGLVASVAFIVAAAALIGPSGQDEGGAGGGQSAQSAEPVGSGESAQGPGPVRASGDTGTLAPPSLRTGDPDSDRRSNRAQQRSASLTLAAPRREIDTVASQVSQVTAELGGFVASSSMSSNRGGSLLLRVPTDRLDTAIQRLSRLGRVRELSRQSVDITSSVVSARERLRDARTERKALLAQLADADTVNETESIRERLAIVSREIAAARRALQRVNNRANFADVSVTLAPSRAGDDDSGAWTPADAFDDALRVLEVAAGVALLAAAVLLPVALIWLLAWLARRGISRRRRERALDMA